MPFISRPCVWECVLSDEGRMQIHPLKMFNSLKGEGMCSKEKKQTVEHENEEQECWEDHEELEI